MSRPVSEGRVQAEVREDFAMTDERKTALRERLVSVVQREVEQALVVGGRPEVSVSVLLTEAGMEVVLEVEEKVTNQRRPATNTKDLLVTQRPLGAQVLARAQEADLDVLVERALGSPTIEAAIDAFMGEVFG